VALRRSALRVAPAGPLQGCVTAARSTPDAVRLRVEVHGVGEVDAVAAPGGSVPGVGRQVSLVVDLTRTARLQAT
jgi:thiamine transport system ATP-binding protein